MRLFQTLFVLVCFIAVALPAKSLQGPGSRSGAATEPIEDKWERERKKARNEERQKELKQDTDKLYQLATELKDHVGKTNENMLSLDVIRKAEEIEKLAKKVREKMKADYLMPGPLPPQFTR
jgi:hypothetical protein